MLESDAMRVLMGLLVIVCVAAGLVISPIRAQQPPYDLLIHNARIVDGTGSPWWKGDIAISGDAIARIAPVIDQPAARVVDAGGAVGLPDSSTSTRTPGAASSTCRRRPTTCARVSRR